MRKEIEYCFRDHYPGQDIQNFMDRQARNIILREAGVPVTVECLDVLISLRTLPPAQRTFEGILEDMVTLTPPEGQIVFDQTRREQSAQKELSLLLCYLSRKGMAREVRNGEVKYKITKQGKTMMKKAREVFGY